MIQKIGLMVLGFLLSCSSLHAATISWAAGVDNGLGLLNGTDLAVGSLIRLGSFNLTDSQISTGANDLSYLNSNFVEFGSSTIGSGVGGIAAHWDASSNADTDALGLVGKQIYLWGFNAATLGSATQHGVFYMNKTNLSSWTFPVQSPVPGSTTIDLTDLTNGAGTALATGATIVIGGFGNGFSDSTSSALFNLLSVSAVPEPSTYLLLGFVATCFGVVGFRRHRF